MTVPSGRMLLAFALTVVPASLAPLCLPAGMEVYWWTLLLFCCVAVADAGVLATMARGITVSFPERLNLTQNREGVLVIRIADSKGRPLSIQVGMALPTGVASPMKTAAVHLPRGEDRLQVSWPLTGYRRGVYAIDRCPVRVSSPLGLWFGHREVAAGAVLHVYPGLQEERKRLSALQAHCTRVRMRPHRQTGPGREFEMLRNYLPGDSPGDIHWKATARRGRAVTREFRIERAQEIYCIIDASRLSARRDDPARAGGPGGTSLDICVSASLLLAETARRQGDRFGVMAFSDKPFTFLLAMSGTSHFGVCREALSLLQPSPVAPDFQEAASFLATRLRRRALLLFLTSLDEAALAEDFIRSLPVLSRRHVVQVHAIRPAFASPLFSESGADTADDVYRRLAGHFVWHDLCRTRETLKHRGVDMYLSDREQFSPNVVTRYLNVKRRQIL